MKVVKPHAEGIKCLRRKIDELDMELFQLERSDTIDEEAKKQLSQTIETAKAELRAAIRVLNDHKN